MTPQPSYVVITPVRDEAEHLPRLARCVIAQTMRPALWVVADDGSADGSVRIAQDLSREHPWIRSLTISSEPTDSYASRIAGGAVPHAFNRALATVEHPWDMLVKLDADLSFSDDYFERLLGRFAEDPQLGIAGGYCYSDRDGRLKMEWVPDYHVRGATKMYRRECFEAIGGVEEVLGWDGIDELRAQMHGWTTRSYADLVVVHHRPNSSRGGVLRGRARGGRNNYFLGYGFMFMLARCVRIGASPPYVVGGLAMLWGYLSALLTGKPRYEDREFRRFLRESQRRRLAQAIARVFRFGR